MVLKRRSSILILFVVFLVLMFVTVSAVLADTIVYSGQGTNNGFCNTIQGGNVPAGQQKWLFILTNPDPGPWELTATFSSGMQTVSGTQQGGGSVHFELFHSRRCSITGCFGDGRHVR
jgi:hypothetical protein